MSRETFAPGMGAEGSLDLTSPNTPPVGEIAPDAQILRRLPHVPDLDGLRAIAVGVVFIGHTHLLPRFPGGFGVTLFFFLSGYLITTLMRTEWAETGRVSLRNFYIRRTLRIIPPLYLTMLFMALLVMVGVVAQSPNALSVVSQALFISNYMPDHGASGLPSPLWSLAVEEHFYLLFPLCFVVAMRRMPASRLAAWCLAACIAVLAVRLLNVAALGISEDNYYWTHTRIDSILFGCILGLWANPAVEEQPAWRAQGWQVFAALAVIVATFAMTSPLLREGVRYSLQGGALFVIFNYQLQGDNIASRFLRWPIIQRIGLWSYALYLVHFSLIYAVQTIAPDLPAPISAVLALVLSCGYCAVMYSLVEKPLSRLRRRYAVAD